MPRLDTYNGVYLWGYVPSLSAAVTFATLFGLVTTAHGWKMVTTRMWFCLPFVIGGVLEEVGFIARAACYSATGDFVTYLIQAIFLVIPPVFFAATLYMVYSRVIRAVQGDCFSLTSERWTTRLFVIGDFICLNIQSTGSGLLAKPEYFLTGEYIIVAGMIIQALMFAVFIICCLVFNIRFRAHLRETGSKSDVPWQACLNMLYWTSLVILARNVYRVVEFTMGRHGYLFQSEWPAYVFDAAPMLLVMISFFIWYPSELQLRRRDSMIELTSDGASTMEQNFDTYITFVKDTSTARPSTRKYRATLPNLFPTAPRL